MRSHARDELTNLLLCQVDRHNKWYDLNIRKHEMTNLLSALNCKIMLKRTKYKHEYLRFLAKKAFR